MEISEKIRHDSLNEARLYKEGIFWVAYEQSAYIISRVKTLKPTKKIVKKLGKEVISVGFPDSELEKIISMFVLKEHRGTSVVMEVDPPCDGTAYLQWKDGTEIMVPGTGITAAAQAVQGGSRAESSLAGRILAFDIGNSTPVQCFVFLNELQQSIIKSNGAIREPAGI